MGMAMKWVISLMAFAFALFAPISGGKVEPINWPLAAVRESGPASWPLQVCVSLAWRYQRGALGHVETNGSFPTFWRQRPLRQMKPTEQTWLA